MSSGASLLLIQLQQPNNFFAVKHRISVQTLFKVISFFEENAKKPLQLTWKNLQRL